MKISTNALVLVITVPKFVSTLKAHLAAVVNLGLKCLMKDVLQRVISRRLSSTPMDLTLELSTYHNNISLLLLQEKVECNLLILIQFLVNNLDKKIIDLF